MGFEYLNPDQELHWITVNVEMTTQWDPDQIFWLHSYIIHRLSLYIMNVEISQLLLWT